MYQIICILINSSSFICSKHD